MAKRAILIVTVGLIGYLALVPVGYLIMGTIFDGERFTLDAFREAYTVQGLAELLWNSLVFSLGATAVAVFIATAMAYLTERTDIPFKGALYLFSLVPLVIPGILYTISWIFLASPRIGLFSTWLAPVLGDSTIDVYSMVGMIVVQGLNEVPLVFLLMVAAFRSMDPSLEESAFVSGARLPKVIAKVTVPLVRPAILGAVLIVTVRNLEAFEVPALLGLPAGINVLTSEIWNALSGFRADYQLAGAHSMTLLAISLVGVYFITRFSSKERAFETITGKGFRARPMPLGRWRWPIFFACVAYNLVAVVMPIAILVYASLRPRYTVPTWSALTDLSFEPYKRLLTSDLIMGAFSNSLILSVTSAGIVMALAAVASWIVVRSGTKASWTVDGLAFVPLVVPGLVLGVALLFIYLRVPLPIYGTLWILMIAYVTKFLPYGMRYATASMRQIGRDLEESAQTSGARWQQSFRRITVPLLSPGLLAGGTYVMMVALRELSTSIVIYSPGNEVLAVLIWDLREIGDFSGLGALGVLMIGILAVLSIVTRYLGDRVGIKR